jgi:Chaperone for flagella basal body P-ring formation
LTSRLCQIARPRGFARRLTAAAALAVALQAPSAPATGEDARAEVRVTGSRVLLKDVLPDCPEQACAADLGPAPPAGSSRLVALDSLRAAFAAAGVPAPQLQAVRVVSAARVWSPAELAELVRPSIERKLPEGVRLLGVQPKAGVTLPLLAVVGDCSLPALPRHPGPSTTTAMVEFLHDGAPVRRVAVQVRLLLSERAARPGVQRGSLITLVIQRASATVSAQGVALQDSEIGQTASFKVQATGRIVQARIESVNLATVLDP